MTAVVAKIIEEVKHLSKSEKDEFFSLLADLEKEELDQWEKQIAQDSKSGKLDALLDDLNADIKTNQTKPLNEVIDEP